jgi:hypothetical protein
MIPRAVLMAKEVANIGVPASQGNILAPNWRSWQNNNQSYYTKGGASLVGQRSPFSYWVPQFNAASAPTWAQPPRRKFTSQRVQYTSTVTPVARGLVASNIVAEINLGVVSNLIAESILINLAQGDGSKPAYYSYYTLDSVYVNSLGETVCVLPIPYTSSNPPGPGPGNIYIGLNYSTQTWVTAYVAPIAPSSAGLYPVANSVTPPPIDVVVWP